jgi:hypothetical protein
MKYSKGICWLDDTRIPFVDSDKETINFDRPRIREKKDWVYDLGTTWENPDVKEYNTQGRFTPNLLVCDDMLNDGSITKKSNPKITPVGIGRGVIGNHDGRKTITKAKEGMEMLRSVGDGGSNSRFYDLDKWFDKVIDSL